MLQLNCIIGISSFGITSRPFCPVGTIVHLRNPDRATAASLTDTFQLALPARLIFIPISMNGNKVTAPATGIHRVDKFIKPIIITSYGRRTQAATGSHHLRPVSQHILDINILFLVISLIIRFVVTQDIGTTRVITHIFNTRPSLMVMLGYILTIYPIIMNTGIPVVSPSRFEFFLHIIVPESSPSTLVDIIPLADADVRDSAVERFGNTCQVDFLIRFIGDEHTAIACTISLGT